MVVFGPLGVKVGSGDIRYAYMVQYWDLELGNRNEAKVGLSSVLGLYVRGL